MGKVDRSVRTERKDKELPEEPCAQEEAAEDIFAAIAAQESMKAVLSASEKGKSKEQRDTDALLKRLAGQDRIKSEETNFGKKVAISDAEKVIEKQKEAAGSVKGKEMTSISPAP